jgi:hypothetical protein
VVTAAAQGSLNFRARDYNVFWFVCASLQLALVDWGRLMRS